MKGQIRPSLSQRPRCWTSPRVRALPANWPLNELPPLGGSGELGCSFSASPPPCKALLPQRWLNCALLWSDGESRIDAFQSPHCLRANARENCVQNERAGFSARFKQAFGYAEQASEYACSWGDPALPGATLLERSTGTMPACDCSGYCSGCRFRQGWTGWIASALTH